MTISSKTTIQAYQLHKGGTPARMAILRMIAADSVNNRNETTRLQPGDWRGARHHTLAGYESAYATLDQGFNDKKPVWYCHTGEQFRGERFADECEGGPDHRGWYTQADCATYKDGTGLARGIVARLSHGRFIAGYHWGDNGERVYFGEVFNSERDAAHAGDEHARIFAESAQEDNVRFESMSLAELDMEEKTTELQKAIALRHRARFGGFDRVRDAIERLRAAREELENATAAYERD